MKKIGFVFLFFLLFQTLHGADLVVQKIGISIDKKSSNYAIDLVLKNFILSSSQENKSISLISADKADLESSGVRELNGKVLIKSVKKDGFYRIELYQTDKGSELFDNSTRILTSRFGGSLEEAAKNIIGILEKRYPQKPVQELIKIDEVKIKLSEYESQEGFWGITLTPTLNVVQIYVQMRDTNNSPQRTFNTSGFSPDIEAYYHYQQFNFSIGGSVGFGGGNLSSQYNFNDFTVHAMIGYGIFGSLIIIGLEPVFYYGKYHTDFSYFDNGTLIIAPNVICQTECINFFILINITKDYFIEFSGAPPMGFNCWSQMWYDFNKNQNNGYQVFYSSLLPTDFGMPMIKLTMNFRINKNLRIQVYYDVFSREIKSDTSSSDPKKQPVAVNSLDTTIKLQDFNLTKSRIGLGLTYEF